MGLTGGSRVLEKSGGGVMTIDIVVVVVMVVLCGHGARSGDNSRHQKGSKNNRLHCEVVVLILVVVVMLKSIVIVVVRCVFLLCVCVCDNTNLCLRIKKIEQKGVKIRADHRIPVGQYQAVEEVMNKLRFT